MDPFIGEIRLMPYTFAPLDWLPCDGTTLPIAGEYQALYTVIGITYGGNGVNNFQLPDLRSFIPVGAGSPTSSTVQLDLGRSTGANGVTLTNINQLPAHKHVLNGANTTTVANKLTQPAIDARPAQVQFNATSTPSAQKAFSSSNNPDAIFAPQAIGL